jgi:probable F420-dependent oxidoreductase
MRVGIITPVLTRVPRGHARWERDAGIAEVDRVAVEADRLGYDFLTCSEHVAVPVDVAEVRGGTYWDPLAVFGFLAARTSSIRLATFVLVLAYHHPLAIVKRYGTLDVVSGGRLVLGVGVGTLEEEFTLLGAPFAGRGPRGDEAIRALRSSFGVRVPQFAGETYEYDGWLVEPAGIQSPPPIWIGGSTARSLRRAVELGEAWAPFALMPDEVAQMLVGARATPAWDRRAEPLDVVLRPERALDPLGAAPDARAAIDRLRRAGATVISVTLRSTSVDHYCEQLAAMRALVDEETG